MNITINYYGLFKGKEPNLEPVPCKTEADIYAALGMEYVEPELREDMGEIEAAVHHTLPVLVQESDLRGVLHVHSTWSDGQNTIREIVEECIARGYQYLGITDHSKAVIETAVEHGVCIEINAHPSRLDMDWRFVERARDRGMKIPIDPDAHVLAGLDVIRYGIGVARKGWLSASDVLNTMETEALLDFFRRRRT